VDVARFGDAVAHSRELRIAQRDLTPSPFQAELLARRGHFFVTQRRVVVVREIAIYPDVRLFGQLRGSVRSVGERGVGVKI